MPRKIEQREFTNEEEFGFSVDIYARDEKTIIKSRIFSATPNDSHFLLRTYETKASFLAQSQSKLTYKDIQIEHNRLIAETILKKRAKDCLEEFARDYAFHDEP